MTLSADPLLVTIDTCVWIEFIDNNTRAQEVAQILEWHVQGLIQVVVSNRVFDPDVQSAENRRALTKLFSQHRIQIVPSAFRWGFSRLSCGDVLNGLATLRSGSELEKFAKLVGREPATLPKQNIGAKLSNKIGDYDSLRDHYRSGRDVFVTLDRRDYFAVSKREKYKRELGLIVQDPSEFIALFASQDL